MALTIRDVSRPHLPTTTVATRDQIEAWVREHATGEPRAYQFSCGTGDERAHLSFALGADFAGNFARRSEQTSLMYFLEENGEDTGEEVQVRWGEDDTQGALEVSRLSLERLIDVMTYYLTEHGFADGNWTQVNAW